MNLIERIEAVEAILRHNARDLPSLVVQSTGIAIASPDDRRIVADRLRRVSLARAMNIYGEIDALNDGVNHCHRRVSYALRFRRAIFGEAVEAAFAANHRDLNIAAEFGALTAQFSEAALSQDATSVDRYRAVRERAATGMEETTRLIRGIAASPLSPEQEAAFHRQYPIPVEPATAYREEAVGLAGVFATVAQAVAERLVLTKERYALIVDALIPAFPEHRDGFTIDAEDSAAEAHNSLGRAAALMDAARFYARQGVAGPA